MYYYLYDSFLGEKKYKNTIARVETRLTDLGINGKINHLSFLKNIQQILGEEVKRGVKTIIVAGNDRTIGQVVNIVADLNVTLGIIPIGDHNKIAELLGIPAGEAACDTISGRIIEKIDLGKINNYYFLTSVEIKGKNLNLECDNDYFIFLERESTVGVCNFDFSRQILSHPSDGRLDVFIQDRPQKLFLKKNGGFSHLQTRSLRLDSEKTQNIFLADEKKIIKTPANIKLAAKKIKVIVGKKRLF